jgi:DNA-binding NtrC family response regulator
MEGRLRSELAFGFANVLELPPLRERAAEYVWPGNVTELKNSMEKLSQRAHGRIVEPEDLPELGDRASGVFFVLPPNGIEFAELERVVLMQALAMANNNQTRAASLLGLTRDQMRYRLAKFEIQFVVDRAAE